MTAAAAHLALQNFEVRPTPAGLGVGDAPDEIVIDWTNTPRDETAEVYLPAVDAAEILRTASRLYGRHRLSLIDAHTVGCQTGGISYIPLPPGSGNGANFAGLISVPVPAGAHKGALYKVVFRQMTNAFGAPPPPPIQISIAERASETAAAPAEAQLPIKWRKVLGTFQVNIPVATKTEMLEKEEIRLSIFRWIAEGIASGDRWHPIFERYLRLLAGKVDALGGNASAIKPSQDGYSGLPGGGGLRGGRGGPGHGRGEPGEGNGGHGDHGGGDHGGGDHGRGSHWGHGDCDEAVTGKVLGLVYDHFGDFDGFILETFEGPELRFHSREAAMEAIVAEAWEHRIVVTVLAARHEPRRPLEIVLRRSSGQRE